MIELSVQHDIDKAVRDLDSVQRRQIPFAASVALNRTARDVQDALADHTSVFDRPKALTRKGTYIERSTKTSLTAKVALKTRARGGPVEEYLQAEIAGGGRADKRSEILLRNAGILPAGYQTRPGSGARMDAYGNMSRGQIVQILSYFKSFGSIHKSGRFKGKTTKSARINRGTKRALVEYFVVPEGLIGLATGIWRRKGRGVEPVLIFIKDATYRKRYDFIGVASKAVDQYFGIRFADAMQLALNTAR